jgi:hypothetical protein
MQYFAGQVCSSCNAYNFILEFPASNLVSGIAYNDIVLRPRQFLQANA